MLDLVNWVDWYPAMIFVWLVIAYLTYTSIVESAINTYRQFRGSWDAGYDRAVIVDKVRFTAIGSGVLRATIICAVIMFIF